MKSIRDKTALITGAAGGIGLSIATALAKSGMRVALTDIDAARLDVAAGRLRKTGVDVFATTLDVTSYADWQCAVDAAEAALGRIKLLCNNAGIGFGSPLHEDDPVRWRTVLEVNALGPFHGCRTLIPRMLEAGDEAHIVNVASLSGLRSNAGTSSYNASKHALVGMTDAMREELAGTPIHLSMIYPGVVRTRFVAHSQQVIEKNSSAPLPAESHRQNQQMEAIHQLGMDPDKVADRIVQAVLNDEYHVFTHCDHKAELEAIYRERLAAFGENADPEYVEDFAALQAAFESAKSR
jgi:NAD(P)-dependent dehydrogenase (short-subunit alcohol dehydrogenase family)